MAKTTQQTQEKRTSPTDQIRRLVNSVTLGGKIVTLTEQRTGTTNKGVPYISFDGVIQCGPTPLYNQRFTTFVQSKKSDGSDSKSYKAVKEWYAKAESALKQNQEVKARLWGSIKDDPYVTSDGKMANAYKFSIISYSQWEEDMAQIDLEGYVLRLEQEKDKEERETGRCRVRLLTLDSYREATEISRIFLPAELVEAAQDAGFEEGITAVCHIDLQPSGTESKSTSKGFGKQATSRPHIEWIMVGCDNIVTEDESDKAITSEQAKLLTGLRKEKLDAVLKEGYKGGNAKENKATTVKKQESREEAFEAFEDPDDMPF